MTVAMGDKQQHQELHLALCTLSNATAEGELPRHNTCADTRLN